jgi:hypothetical protein
MRSLDQTEGKAVSTSRTKAAMHQRGTVTRGRVKFAQARRAWKLAQDRFNSVFGESAAAKLRATLLRIARDERLATLTD